MTPREKLIKFRNKIHATFRDLEHLKRDVKSFMVETAERIEELEDTDDTTTSEKINELEARIKCLESTQHHHVETGHLTGVELDSIIEEFNKNKSPKLEASYSPRYCPTHGQQPQNAWGCPECVRELREELKCKPQLIYTKDRLPDSSDCCAHPRKHITGEWCWGLETSKASYGLEAAWKFMSREDISNGLAYAWLPWWAIPLPADDHWAPTPSVLL
jgi:hypothetical protein